MKSIQALSNEIIRYQVEYLKGKTIETEREFASYQANTKLFVENAKMNHALFSEHMNERQRLIETSGKILDRAIECGDSEMAKIALRILDVISVDGILGGGGLI